MDINDDSLEQYELAAEKFDAVTNPEYNAKVHKLSLGQRGELNRGKFECWEENASGKRKRHSWKVCRKTDKPWGNKFAVQFEPTEDGCSDAYLAELDANYEDEVQVRITNALKGTGYVRARRIR